MKIKKTVSDKVIIANRKNSGNSTGPRSADAKSALKYHAVKHGLLTKALSFRNDEEKVEFRELASELEEDLKPRGILQGMLVQEIAVCWWKLQTTQRLQVEELRSRRKASTAILKTFIHCDESADPTSTRADDLRSAAPFGWECRELVLSVVGKQSEEESTSLHDDHTTEKRGHLGFEAKLGNSAESLLRYESSWKRDLYRAIAALRNLQMEEQALRCSRAGQQKPCSAKQSH
jgi:hypothetical protein